MAQKINVVWGSMHEPQHGHLPLVHYSFCRWLMLAGQNDVGWTERCTVPKLLVSTLYP